MSSVLAVPLPRRPRFTDLCRYRVIGLCGTGLLAAGACAAGALPVGEPFYRFVGVRHPWARPGPLLAMTLVYAGLGLLVLGWVLLGRIGARASTAPPCTRYVITTLVLWSTPLCLAPPLFSRDVYSYVAAGWEVSQGVDPYRWGPDMAPGPYLAEVSSVWRSTPSPYGPVFLVLSRAVVGLAGSVVPAVLLFRLLALVGVVLLVVYLPRVAVHFGVRSDQALWLGVLNPLVLVHFVSGAHNDALLVGLLVAGLALALERRPACGVAVCSLALLVKAPAGLALVFLVPAWAGMLRGRARLLRAAGGTLLVGGTVVVAVTVATGLGYGWVGALRAPGTVSNWLSVSTQLGPLAGLLARVADASVPTAAVLDTSLLVFRTAGGLVAVAIVVVLLARLRRLGLAAALGLALTAVVVLAPAVHPWYLAWGFLPIAAGSPAASIRRPVVVASAVLVMVLAPSGEATGILAIAQALTVGLLLAGITGLFELPRTGRAGGPAPSVT